MATIKAIEERTVHQIQSGQVIVDLCSVVKELVENSLDAGATTIDVRFKNQGLDSIEVQDNGDGISLNNYETIALKHYTSKLSTYSDLTTLQTFGFRGEALSSLCALSQFSIVTCVAADAPKGTKLEFEVSGKLKDTGVVAAQKGTTVTVENLFNNLPVRRKELERNIKREWNRVVGVLGQYACIQTGIKFSVSQQPPKGKKATLFSTKGNQTTRENIVNVFGAKTLTALITLELNLELEATIVPSQRWSTQDDGGTKEIRIVGHISRPASGEGRQTPDRQMFFVNSRPCGLPQVSKAFNEVYKSYNGTQSPFIFANIELDTHLYDVNVSPDKRTILLHDQSRMLENLKTALTELFESQDYTVPISQLPTQKQPTYKQLTISQESTARAMTSAVSTGSASAKRGNSIVGDDSEAELRSPSREQSVDEDAPSRSHDSASRGSAKVSRDLMNRDREAMSLISNWVGRKSEDRPSEPAVQPLKAATTNGEMLSKEKRSLIEKFRKEGQDQSVDEEEEEPIPAIQSPIKPSSTLLSNFSSSRPSRRASPAIATITIGHNDPVTSSLGTPSTKRPRIEERPPNSRSETPDKPLPSFGSKLSQRFAAPGATQRSSLSQEVEYEAGTLNDHEASPDHEDANSEEESEPDPETEQDIVKVDDVESSLLNPVVPDDDDDAYIDEEEKKAQEEAKVQGMIGLAEEATALPSQQNVDRAKALLKGSSKKKDSTMNLLKIMETNVSKISDQIIELQDSLASYSQRPSPDSQEDALDSEQAEERLSLTISKSDFAGMKIVGQFNLGFILATRSADSTSDSTASIGDELFIIDQHASDEKYNFERLQAITVVQSQPLVTPKTLDLTAVEEEIVLENLKALETNGFVVRVDESGFQPVGQRCQLISLPVSKETTFSLTDLEELLALLLDHPPGNGSVPRPSKVRKMFAMRACRSSIMIGKTLTHRQMGKVVRHLGELDKPWNCPHGRPTMRHLCGLGAWDEAGWKESTARLDIEGEDDLEEPAERTDWAAYVRGKRGVTRYSSP